MKLVKVKLKNFRCYQKETSFNIGDFTAFIGRNDCGKSTILDALLIFFDDGVPDSDDARVNTLIRRTLWDSVSDHKLKTTEIPLNEEAAKQVWSQLSKNIPTYALFKSDRPSTDQDAEAQDPMKAAVKEAIKEKEEELSRISKFIQKQVKEIADQTVSKIKKWTKRWQVN